MGGKPRTLLLFCPSPLPLPLTVWEWQESQSWQIALESVTLAAVVAGSLVSLLTPMPFVNFHSCLRDLNPLTLNEAPVWDTYTQTHTQAPAAPRTLAAATLIAYGHKSHWKERTWMVFPVLSVAVTGMLPLTGSTKKKGRPSFPRGTHANRPRDPNTTVLCPHSLGRFPRAWVGCRNTLL